MAGRTRASSWRELQVAVDVEAGVVSSVGNDGPSGGRMALIDDGVAEVALFGFEGNFVGVDGRSSKDGQDNQDGAAAGQFGFEGVCGQVGGGLGCVVVFGEIRTP